MVIMNLFFYSCSIELGSSGSQILNLSNNKMIGWHKEGNKDKTLNIGGCLSLPIQDFINLIKNYKEKYFSFEFNI